MGETIIDGRGNYNPAGSKYIVGVTEDNKLMVDANVTASSASDIQISGAVTNIGSLSLVGGQSNGSAWPLRLFNGSYLMVAGSISSMPSVTATNDSITKIGVTHTGSITLIGGDYAGAGVALRMEGGSQAVIVGSVFQATSPWVVLGSFAQTNAGSVRQLTSPWITLGSTQITNPETVGSLATQTVTGSVALTTGSVNIYGAISATNPSVYAITDIVSNTGSLTLAGAQFNGSALPLRLSNGSELLVAGSTRIVNQVNVSVVGTPTVTVSGTVTIDVSGSLPVSQSTTPWVIIGSVRQLTSPWVTLGSTQITNPDVVGSLAVQTITGSVALTTGSVNVYGALSATNPSVYALSGIVANTGSATLIGAQYNGSNWALRMANGSNLLVDIGNLGSVAITTTPIPISGTVTQGGTWNINNLTTGSVRVVSQADTTRQITAGSIKIMGASGADFYPLLVTSGTIGILRTDINSWPGSIAITTDPVPVSGGVIIRAGSIQTYSPLGVGSIYGIGIGSVFALVTGSVRQLTDPWIVLGSTQVTNPTAVGSLAVQTISGVVHAFRPTVINGSILVNTADRLGSKILPTLQNTINWIAVKYVNQGSQYAFGIKDAEGYLVQSLLQHQGDWAYLSPVPASGVLVFTVSGTQTSGVYDFRVAYT